MNFELNRETSSIIKVIGVGGGGGNAVNHMYKQGIRDVNFIVVNTDNQVLQRSPVPMKIQIGPSLTSGLGAGNKPEKGRQAAIENLDEVMEAIGTNTRMVFITAGMGGGTGTGAAPVIAKAARDAGILTVAIVTMPFKIEGRSRMENAIQGLDELYKNVDSMLVINNEKVREIYGDLKLSDAFAKADNVLTAAAKGIAEIITIPGYINVDFADVQTVMAESGIAIMGSAIAEGEGRALAAVKGALTSPLLDYNDIKGAKNVLLNITSGNDEVTMDEVSEITDYLAGEIDIDATVIWGNCSDSALGEGISVTIIATGFNRDIIPELYARNIQREKVSLTDAVSDSYRDGKVSLTFEQPTTVNFQVKEKLPEKIEFEDEDEVMSEKAIERLKRIKGAEEAMTNGKVNRVKEKNNMEDLYTEPAYKRRNVKLGGSDNSSGPSVSRYSLFGNDEGVKLNSDNSYLHDNVD